MEKFCRDCRYIKPETVRVLFWRIPINGMHPSCTHPNLDKAIDPVTGGEDAQYPFCTLQRKHDSFAKLHFCGKAGNWYEPKEQKHER